MKLENSHLNMKQKSEHKRTTIPVDVRNRLWIAAAGRCEFSGCCKPVGIDFLTGRKANVGELAHIVSDSPAGPRGHETRSKELAKDEANLMLACFECHARIDRVREVEEFPETLLLRWKREHEARVSAIYNAEMGTLSLPVLMAMPVGQHVPSIDPRQIHAAVLKNSDYKIHPQQDAVILNRADLDIRDDDPEFWDTAEKALVRWYSKVLEPRLVGKEAAPHVTIAAFAPIPMAMKLGALIGDKRQAMVLDLPSNNWLWKTDDSAETSPDDWFVFDVPETLPARVFVTVDVSNMASNIDVLADEAPIVRFSARAPKRELIGSHKQLEGFRKRFNDFLTSLHRAGAREIDLLPVTSLSTSVELGRLILPKIFSRVTVWEYQKEVWSKTLNLVSSKQN